MTLTGTTHSDPTKEAWHYEYYHLQGIVTSYNKDCLAIKNWSVTVASAAIGYAYVESKPMLLIVAAASATAFLLTEAYWRANQMVFLKIIRKLERDIETGNAKPSPHISTSWVSHWKEENYGNDLGHVLRAAVTVRAALPHGLIILAALLLYNFFPSAPDAKASTHVVNVYCNDEGDTGEDDSPLEPAEPKNK